MSDLKLSQEIRDKIGRNVYGEGMGEALYYHNGHYYAADGRYLDSVPGVTPPAGARPDPNKASSEADSGSDEAQSREQILLGKTPSQLKSLMKMTIEGRDPPMADEEAAKLIAETTSGEGAKARTVAWLLANTTT